MNQSQNPEMSALIAQVPAFRAIMHQVEDDRIKQAMQFNYSYFVTGTVKPQATTPFSIVIEQGTDFKSNVMLGSAYSYDAVNASSFPTPNTVGSTAWACRGLSVRITDTRQGRELTSGFVPFECLFTPGYGMTFVRPLSFKYLFLRNSTIRFEVSNAETNTSRKAQSFAILFNGYKVMTPND